MEKRFIGIHELAEYIDISSNTLRYWVWRKEIPYLKIGKLLKFDIMKINQWLKEKEVKVL